MIGVRLNQFYGIELADFAVETTKLSLWIAEYQINEQFKAVFGSAPPALPLKDSGNIVQGNATRLNWLKVCPKAYGADVYLASNPPYVWSSDQTKEQKNDVTEAFEGVLTHYETLDYVSIWLAKGADYILQTGAKCGFVTTNSICQGEQ